MEYQGRWWNGLAIGEGNGDAKNDKEAIGSWVAALSIPISSLTVCGIVWQHRMTRVGMDLADLLVQLSVQAENIYTISDK